MKLNKPKLMVGSAWGQLFQDIFFCGSQQYKISFRQLRKNYPPLTLAKLKPLIILLGAFLIASCQKSGTDIQETAQQIGDVMASIDESGGVNGSFTRGEFLQGEDNFSRALCRAATFSTCSSQTRTRTFSDCTLGGTTVNGSVILTFSDVSCGMGTTNDYVSRNPSFTVTGRRGATLTVSKTGSVGQRVTRGASSFTFSNDGIRRVFTAGSSTLFDFTTSTTSNLVFTGSSRDGRVLSSGTLRVLNNLNSVTCDYTPSSVTWNSTCNCAISGSWSATCSDGKASTLTITGCGTASFTMGTDTENLTFDRCYSI